MKPINQIKMNNTGQIIKSRSTDKFTTLPNDITQSGGLTLEQKGLLSYLLSLPSNWVLYKANLYTILPDKAGTIDRIFRELQDKGYIISEKVIDERGHFKGWNHVVYDVPTAKDNLPERHEPRPRQNPTSEAADLGQSSPIQRHIEGTNTNSITKKETTVDAKAVKPQTELEILVETSYNKFNTWLSEESPEVLKMKKPITLREYTLLWGRLKRKEFTSDTMQSVLIAMGNSVSLKNYISAYRTLINWIDYRKTHGSDKQDVSSTSITDKQIPKKLA